MKSFVSQLKKNLLIALALLALSLLSSCPQAGAGVPGAGAELF